MSAKQGDEGGGSVMTTERKRGVRRFWRRRDGVVAVEFAMLAPMFFLVLMAIFETSMITLAQSGLRAGLSDLSRVVRTGRGQCLEDREARDIVCALAFVPDCQNALAIERRRFPTGLGAATAAAGDFGDLGADELVQLRVRYAWQVVTPIMMPFYGDENGERMLEQSIVFMNEGFGGATC